MLILALLRRCESLPICDRTYVIERRSRTRRISYDPAEETVSSPLLCGSISGNRSFLRFLRDFNCCCSTTSVKFLFEERA